MPAVILEGRNLSLFSEGFPTRFSCGNDSRLSFLCSLWTGTDNIIPGFYPESNSEILRGACPELNDETLRLTQGDKAKGSE